MSQEELAKIIGKTASTVQKYETYEVPFLREIGFSIARDETAENYYITFEG